MVIFGESAGEPQKTVNKNFSKDKILRIKSSV